MQSDESTEIEPVSFRQGEILFRENEHSFHFFILQEGQVEVYKLGPGGKKVSLAVVGEGTSIGEFAMIDRLPRSATAQAISEVKAVKVSDAAYQKLLSELPDWAMSVMRALVDRLRQTNEILRRSGSMDPSTRKEIESVEFDPEAGTVVDTVSNETNPMLGSED